MAFTAFSTALSALSAQTTAVDVVGNNLANINTPGFKGSTVVFHDLVTQSLGLGETQVGLGVARPTTLRQFSQGALQSSSGVLDAAIQGDGFFMLKDSNGGALLTRAGNFHVDNAGNLLTPTGEIVQGWTETLGIMDTNGPTGNIVVPVGTLRSPRATSSFSFHLNLNSNGVVGATSGTFSTPLEVVDSLGTSHVVTLTLTKTAPNACSRHRASAPLTIAASSSHLPTTASNSLRFGVNKSAPR